MGLLPLFLVIGGGALAVYGANRWLEVRTHELETPGRAQSGRRRGSTMVRVGGLMAAAGVVWLAIDIVLRTVLAILSLVITVLVVVAVIVVLARLLGGRRSKSG